MGHVLLCDGIHLQPTIEYHHSEMEYNNKENVNNGSPVQQSKIRFLP